LSQFLNNDPNCPSCGDCPQPWVKPHSCAPDLRRYCNASGPLHTRAMMYGISGCADPALLRQEALQSNWTALADLEQDVVNFLLLRGEHAYLVGFPRNRPC
jgi:hypothetical protein